MRSVMQEQRASLFEEGGAVEKIKSALFFVFFARGGECCW
jgi:hypothetical protein